MSWRCIFGHIWIPKSATVQKYFEYDDSPRPHMTETLIVYECKKCGRLKFQSIVGTWTIDTPERNQSKEK